MEAEREGGGGRDGGAGAIVVRDCCFGSRRIQAHRASGLHRLGGYFTAR